MSNGYGLGFAKYCTIAHSKDKNIQHFCFKFLPQWKYNISRKLRFGCLLGIVNTIAKGCQKTRAINCNADHKTSYCTRFLL